MLLYRGLASVCHYTPQEAGCRMASTMVAIPHMEATVGGMEVVGDTEVVGDMEEVVAMAATAEGGEAMVGTEAMRDMAAMVGKVEAAEEVSTPVHDSTVVLLVLCSLSIQIYPFTLYRRLWITLWPHETKLQSWRTLSSLQSLDCSD